MSFDKAVNLSIRVRPNASDNVKAFGLPGVEEKGFRAGDFVGSIDEGGYLNCKVLTLAPHGMGTHSESVRHILKDGPAVCDVVPLRPFRVRLITVQPTPLGKCGDSYRVGSPGDLVLSKAGLNLSVDDLAEVSGLIVRTPGAAKEAQDHTGTNPSYFTKEAMSFIAEHIDHLLVDLPSVDRESDEGLLLNHRRFWKVVEGAQEIQAVNASTRTITEMISVPTQISDGQYWCLIAVPHIDTDALPSRVLIWK